jgi:hypothetical protein
MFAGEGLIRALHERQVRFVAIGVWGANYYAAGITELFSTQDEDLFLPPDPDNLLRAWEACDSAGLELTCGSEPLDRPRDLLLAEKVVERRALTRAGDGRGLVVDLTLVMAGFDFETVWKERRTFLVDGVEVPVARLLHIVESKALAGRPKDLLFLETHKEMLRELQERHQHRSS